MKFNLGKVSLMPRGEYDPLLTYAKLDIVTYQGSAYVALKDDVMGVIPSNDKVNYFLLVEKGEPYNHSEEFENLVASLAETEKRINEIKLAIEESAKKFAEDYDQKLQDFNSNHVQKLKAYNDNALAKTNEFDLNAQETINLANKDAESARQSAESARQSAEKLSGVSGNNILLNTNFKNPISSNSLDAWNAGYEYKDEFLYAWDKSKNLACNLSKGGLVMASEGYICQSLDRKVIDYLSSKKSANMTVSALLRSASGVINLNGTYTFKSDLVENIAIAENEFMRIEERTDRKFYFISKKPIVLDSVKVELGKASTIENDAPFNQNIENVELFGSPTKSEFNRLKNDTEKVKNDALEIYRKYGENGIDSRELKGKVFNETFVNDLTILPKAYDIVPAFGFSHDESCVVNIWFTDGTNLTARNGIYADFLDAKGDVIQYYSLGNVTNPTESIVGAEKIRIRSQFISDGMREYFGKTIQEATFTLAKNKDVFTPFKFDYKSKSIESCNKILDLKHDGISKNALDDSQFKNIKFDINTVNSWIRNPPVFKIQNAFDFSHDEPCTGDIWFTDGSSLFTIPGIYFTYLDNKKQVVQQYNTGDTTKSIHSIKNAKYIRLDVYWVNPALEQFYEKTIQGITFTLAENSEKYKPFTLGTTSEFLNNINEQTVKSVKLAESYEQNYGLNFDKKFVENYAKTVKESGDSTYQCLFFTDPHPYPEGKAEMFPTESNAFNILSGTSKNMCIEDVLCGGDWLLGSGKAFPVANAQTELSLACGLGNKLFDVPYRPVVGNHEYAENEAYIKQLNDAQIRKLYMPRFDKLWYSYESVNNKVICLNTGGFAKNPISEEQKAFLKAELLSAKKDIIIVCHIIYDGPNAENAPISNVFSSILDELDAYNNRSGDYASVQNKVLCTLAGHMHAYMHSVSATGIQLIAFDKLVSDMQRTINFYGVVIDNTNSQIKIVQTVGKNIVYDLPR